MPDEILAFEPKRRGRPPKVEIEEAATSSSSPSTVPMKRNAEQWPVGPHTAEVHLDEVDNWAKHGWERVD